MDLAYSMPIGEDFKYTQSRITGRPSQAAVILATQAAPTKIDIDPGSIDRKSLTLFHVIMIPIVYKDNP